MVSQPVGGVLSGVSRRVGGHPSERPTSGCPSGASEEDPSGPGGYPCPHLALLRVGFAEPSRSPVMLVRSYRTVSPLPVRRHPVARPAPPSAVCSLWHFPSGRPAWPLASTLPCGAPTFLDTVTSTRCDPSVAPCRDHLADSPSGPVCPTTRRFGEWPARANGLPGERSARSAQGRRGVAPRPATT